MERWKTKIFKIAAWRKKSLVKHPPRPRFMKTRAEIELSWDFHKAKSREGRDPQSFNRLRLMSRVLQELWVLCSFSFSLKINFLPSCFAPFFIFVWKIVWWLRQTKKKESKTLMAKKPFPSKQELSSLIAHWALSM